MIDSTALFWALLAVGLIACGFIIALFQRLRLRHPQKYVAMGEPKIYYKYSIWPVLKFIFKREHRHLNDRGITLLTYAIGSTLLVYVLIFLLLLLDTR